MTPRRMLDLDQASHDILRALAFVTGRSRGELLAAAVGAVLASDPALAAAVAAQLAAPEGEPGGRRRRPLPTGDPGPGLPLPPGRRRGVPRLPVGPRPARGTRPPGPSRGRA